MPTTANTTSNERLAAGRLTHLQRLEAESIQIMREAVAESENPVMLYSIGKDSSVMLHLALKAFYPSQPPFPLLHVDTTWKFQAMYEFRDEMAAELGIELLVHQNPECVERGINPFDHGSAVHTDMWKTEGLKQALDHVRLRPARSAAPGATRRSPGPRSGSSRSARRSTSGTRSTSGRSCGALYNVRRSPGETHARVPAVELDRARRVAVHPPRADPDRAALLRGARGRSSSATAR